MAGVVKLMVLMLMECFYFSRKRRGEFRCLWESLSHYVTMSKLIISGFKCFFRSLKSSTSLGFGEVFGYVNHVYQPMIATPLFIRLRVVRVEISKCFILPSRKKVSIVYLQRLQPTKTNMTIEKQAFEDVSPIKNRDFLLSS